MAHVFKVGDRVEVERSGNWGTIEEIGHGRAIVRAFPGADWITAVVKLEDLAPVSDADWNQALADNASGEA